MVSGTLPIKLSKFNVEICELTAFCVSSGSIITAVCNSGFETSVGSNPTSLAVQGFAVYLTDQYYSDVIN